MSRMSFRVSSSQLNILLDFVTKNPILNKGVVVGRSKMLVQKLWAKVTAKLNAQKDGNRKDALHWKRYWISLKNKVKTKTITWSREREAGVKRLTYLTEYDKKVLSIIAKEGTITTPDGDSVVVPDHQEDEDPELDLNENDANDEVTNLKEFAEAVEHSNINMDNGNDTSRPRVSMEQQELLVQFMERLPSLARGRGRGRREAERVHRSWDKIALALNKVDPQHGRNGHGWLKYWTCMKSTLRTRYLLEKKTRAKDALDGFTPLQLRILKVVAVDLDHGDDQKDNDDTKIHPTERVDVNNASPLKVECVDDETEDEKTTPEDDYDDPAEDPIDTTIKPTRKIASSNTKEDYQNEFLRFQLEKQKERHIAAMEREKEMHELQIRTLKERHALEMEILELKKKRLMFEYNQNRKLHITLQQYNQNEN